MTLNEKHSIYLISRTPLCLPHRNSRTRCLVLRGNTGDVATTFNQGSGRRAGLGCMNFSKYSSTTTTTRVYCRFSPSITGPFYQSAWDEWWYTVVIRQLAGTVQLFYCRYAEPSGHQLCEVFISPHMVEWTIVRIQWVVGFCIRWKSTDWQSLLHESEFPLCAASICNFLCRLILMSRWAVGCKNREKTWENIVMVTQSGWSHLLCKSV